MLNFNTIQHLKDWLIAKGIDQSQWGTDGTKTVENLWAEIVAGETELQDDPPLRLIRVVNIIVRQGDKILIEGEQEFGDNQRRYRGVPPAEKMKPRESHIEAALRGLAEELQVQPAQVKILPSPPQPQPLIQESQSYPGLRTKYLIYTVEVNIDGLPAEDFSTLEGSPAGSHDPIKRHQWHWVAGEEVVVPNFRKSLGGDGQISDRSPKI